MYAPRVGLHLDAEPAVALIVAVERLRRGAKVMPEPGAVRIRQHKHACSSGCMENGVSEVVRVA